MLDNEASNRDNDAALDAQELGTFEEQPGLVTVVTIGAGLNPEDYPGEEHLSNEAWGRFRTEVAELLGRYFGAYGVPTFFSGDGIGNSETWGIEDAHTWVLGEFPYYLVWNDFAADLREIASRYGQEAVAVTTGRTTFV